jgi:hypothetical protein
MKQKNAGIFIANYANQQDGMSGKAEGDQLTSHAEHNIIAFGEAIGQILPRGNPA